MNDGHYSATTWPRPLGTKLTNQSVNWEQRVATFFVNGPKKLKNANNDIITKVWNPTKLGRVADLSGNLASFWLVHPDPIFWNIFRLFNVSNDFAKLLNKISWFSHNGLCPLHSIETESIGGAYTIMVVDFPNWCRGIFIGFFPSNIWYLLNLFLCHDKFVPHTFWNRWLWW